MGEIGPARTKELVMTGFADSDALMGLLSSPEKVEAMTNYIVARQKKS